MPLDYDLLQRTSLGAVGPLPTTVAASTSDSRDTLGYTRKNPFPRSSIEVNLHHHFRHKVYTSSSPVSGNVTITTKREVRFDSIQIILVGSTRTRVDGINSPREVTHTFLKMAMPVPSSTYPVPRILESGQTYTIPFNFVIPNYLTIGACNHHILNEQLQDQHVCLPPTMGKWEKDDMAPQMAQVDYQVKARVFRQPDLGQRKIKVMEATQSLLILPASAEEPPLNITKHDRIYKLSHSKTLRKNLLAGKLGRLTAEAAQPQAAILRPDGLAISNTTTRIDLKFDPAAADILPPKVTGVSAKVIAHTYYSAGSIAQLPNLGEWSKQVGVEKRGEYQTSVGLPHVTETANGGRLARWTQHLSSAVRRDSGYASDVSDGGRRGSGASKKHSPSKPASPIFHTATLQIPIDMTAMLAKKTPIPTFHSCITSRVYTLHLTVSLASGTATNTVNFSLPLQIVVEEDPRHGSGLVGLPSFEESVQEAEVDEFLRPRLMQVPEQSYVGNSSLPGYGDMM